MKRINSTRMAFEVCQKASEARGSGVAMRSGWEGVELGGDAGREAGRCRAGEEV